MNKNGLCKSSRSGTALQSKGKRHERKTDCSNGWKKTRLLPVKTAKDSMQHEAARSKDFTFDHSYWSYDSDDKHYAAQEQVFADLGLDVIDSAFEGYNACVFAYGQTGSGKTFTMMGSSEYQGLIPRICRCLFSRVAAGKEKGASYRTEVSYLEIYNERVKDLLASEQGHSLRVREHPKRGPYVQDLSKHLVSDYDDIQECMHRGNMHRTTASTQMNDVSSRSHAIFTITFVQASYLEHNNMPSETVSKVHLVDLAGSERADATGATGQRLVEGAHINKSLVTLGSVISALAESSALQNVNGAKNSKTIKNVFIPYRDSVLTWLLKDSLGGNSKTIMIAAISPADCNYGETLSTLRYANRAKNIINKPTINEDPNVKLIRELREEIENLRSQIGRSVNAIEAEPQVLATLQRKEAQEKVLTEKWTEKWRETQQILQEQKALGLRKSGLGVVLDSDMPHLVGIDDNLLSTGVTLYHLKEGETLIGSEECESTADIVLTGAGVLPEHCRILLQDGVATIQPLPNAQCWLNTVLIDKPAKLSQGCILLLGRTNMFRYNDPAEAAKLRREGSASAMNLSRLSLLSWSTTDLAASTENLNAVIGEVDSEIRSEAIEAQRLELMKEREEFQQQQVEKQQKWHKEKEILEEAQKKLDEERQQMEREYAAACRRLSGDWKALERGWGWRRRLLRQRQTELSARRRRLHGLSETHQQMVDNEMGRVSSLQTQIAEKEKEMAKIIRNSIELAMSRGAKLNDNELPSPDESVLSTNSTDSLMQLLQQCDSQAARTIRDLVNTHKKELTQLEYELQTRVASLASHKAKVQQLESELALLTTQEVGLEQTLLDVGSDVDLSQSVDMTSSSDKEFHEPYMKRSKSYLSLFREDKMGDSVAAGEENKEPEQIGTLNEMKNNLNLDLEQVPYQEGAAEDTFHTANSDCPANKQFPTDNAPPSPVTTTDISMLGDDLSSRMTSSSEMPREDVSSEEVAESTASKHVPIAFKLGPMPRLDDSDEMSSTDECAKRPTDGQSTSSQEKSPEDRHQRARLRRKMVGEGGKLSGRRVTEAEALRAMQKLCQRIAAQKMLVISSLENDCSKEELNHQIAVLQELQKKYIRLEMALQYSFFDNQSTLRSRNIMVTPIQETPSLTLSESDMQVATENPAAGDSKNSADNRFTLEKGDPLTDRLKEGEVEASDNVDTSNDETAGTEPETNDNNWSTYVDDPLRSHRTSVDKLSENSYNSRKSSSDSRPSNSYSNDRRNSESQFMNTSVAAAYNGSSLQRPVDFAKCISIPSYVIRGAGKSTHHEYDVRVNLGDGEKWALLRRYRRFRELYVNMKATYGPKVASIPFPPRQLWSTDSVARSRRPQLETFLRRLLNVCSVDKRCPFYAQPLTKETLIQFSPFFRKGVFETGKCGTG